MMPIEGDSFRLQLSEYFDANTTWEDQCYGCGGPGVTRDLTLAATCREGTHEDPPCDTYILGAFCSSECIGRSISELSRCSLAWKESIDNSHLFLENSDKLFWNSLSKDQMMSMMDAGWSDWESNNWILLHDSESDQDDSELDEDDSESDQDYYAGNNYDLDQDDIFDSDYDSDHHHYVGADLVGIDWWQGYD